MSVGVRGRLITASFAAGALPTLPGAEAPPASVVRALESWSESVQRACGPASSVRAITDYVVIPLLRILGFSVAVREHVPQRALLDADHAGGSIPAIAVRWDDSLDLAWRAAVVDGIRADARWAFCSNGRALRIVDTHRAWSRAYLEFDLAVTVEDSDARMLLWSVARAESFAPSAPLLDRAADLSARHGVMVCRALGRGVLEALTILFGALGARPGRHDPDLFEQSLTILYRVLFLLFAEARGLVPLWHPVYRDRYSIDVIVTTLMAGRRYPGMWYAIVAISRLAHAGCTAGELRVTAFNGRLFSPAHSTAFDRVPLADEALGRAVMAVSTTRENGATQRIAYGDLDVEQLGAVYEHVLEYEPSASTAVRDRSRDLRKSSGTYYTPRAVTASLVRQTLAPLVARKSADDILRLRVLDLAMGSGAFLVGACRFLAHAAEDALIRDGQWHVGDVTAAERASLRREVALRCLYGVDVNPMAVQLARLSLWLVTLASEKPLTFLDHHLVAGDSLVGASLDDLRRQAPGRRSTTRRREPLPLLEHAALEPVLEQAVRVRVRLASEPDDSAAIVGDKEKALLALQRPDSSLGRWSRVLDLWCAAWFWEGNAEIDARLFGELSDFILRDRSTLPSRIARELLDRSQNIAARHRFLHWPVSYPEIFWDERGNPLTNPGFDAVVGNPPWDMVRGDSGTDTVRAGRRDAARRLTDFVREAGIYRVESRSHVNRYQLFAERALQLTKTGGRIGLVLPAGVVTDAGAAGLRRHLFDRAGVDAVAGFDNRSGIFPIHRSARFVLLAATRGQPTEHVACRFGLTRAEQLEEDDRSHRPLVFSRGLLSRLSGADDLGIPELTTHDDLRIVEQISARHAWLGSADGWNVRFGRELNATDDRRLFVPSTCAPGARPVLEGKQIEPFRVACDASRYEVRADSPTRVPRRARLAYRDIASATNRVTLMTAIVPARAVTTHTLFCLKTPLPLDAQRALGALMNSFVANYLIRFRVNTHVTASLVSRLAVPVITPAHPAFTQLVHLARTLADGTAPVESMPEYAELQALSAHLYGLDAAAFAHVLETFPLIPEEIKSMALARFEDFH
jgi:hypothetical protein